MNPWPDSPCRITVEVAFVEAGRVAVRDSKDRSGPVLVFTGAEWSAFLTAARTHRLDG